LLTTTEPAPAPNDPLGPVHPGEILREEFLAPLSLSAYALAAACHVPRTRIERLARYFGTSAEFWLGIQARYDLEVARRALHAEIEAIEPRETA